MLLKEVAIYFESIANICCIHICIHLYVYMYTYRALRDIRACQTYATSNKPYSHWILQVLEPSLWFQVLLFCHRTQYWVTAVSILVRNTIAWIEETVFYCRATCTAFLQVLYIKSPVPRMHGFHFFLFLGISLVPSPENSPCPSPLSAASLQPSETATQFHSVQHSEVQWIAVQYFTVQCS